MAYGTEFGCSRSNGIGMRKGSQQIVSVTDLRKTWGQPLPFQRHAHSFRYNTIQLDGQKSHLIITLHYADSLTRDLNRRIGYNTSKFSGDNFRGSGPIPAPQHGIGFNHSSGPDSVTQKRLAEELVPWPDDH